MHNFKLVACDTDGIAICKDDESPWTDEERAALLDELNSQMDELIKWEDDGVKKCQIVIKTKNYIMQDHDGEITIKGSGLKATTKEKALQRFIRDIIDLLLTGKKDQLLFLYLKYVHEIMNLKDITEWCKKVTITKAVLNPGRTNEERITDAIAGINVQEGDKIYVFNKTDTELCLRENFDGTYCVDTLLGKLYDTLKMFGTVIDVEVFPKFTLKRNKELLADIGYVPKEKPTKPSVKKAAAKVLKEHAPLLKKLADAEAKEFIKPQFPFGFLQTR